MSHTTLQYPLERARLLEIMALELKSFSGMRLRNILYLGLICTALNARGLTLEEYLSEVQSSNPSLKSAVLRSEALSDRVRPAGTWDDPFIAAGIDEQPFQGEDTTSVRRYQISQSVPFPGKLSAKQKSAERRAEASRNDAETQRRSVTVLATQVFFRSFYNQQAIAATERIRNLVQETMNSTKARYRTGEAGHHDWLLAKVELSVIDVERLRLAREQKTLAALFNELRNQPPEKTIEPLKVEFRGADKNIPDTETLLKNQPELSSLNFLASAAEQDERAAKLSYFPDFVLQGMMMEPRGMRPAESGMGMGDSEPEMKKSWGFMIGMTLPIFAFRKQSDLASAASRERAAALYEKQILENRIRSEVVDAREQLKTAQDTVSLYKESVVPATNLAASNARTGYAARRLPLSQFLETIKAQRTQELEFLAAQIDVELAKTRLEEVLSAPPVLRLAPSRPTLFGGGSMGAMAPGMSGTVNMGSGMSGPSRKSGGSAPSTSGGSTGMEGM